MDARSLVYAVLEEELEERLSDLAVTAKLPDVLAHSDVEAEEIRTFVWMRLGGTWFPPDDWDDVQTIQGLIDKVVEFRGVDYTPASLPHSITFEADLYRWHDVGYLTEGDELMLVRAFQDGPWKWDAPGRFAGAGINCGHYFGVHPAAATAEADFYSASHGERRSLRAVTMRARLDNILDLTSPEGIRVAWDACVEGANVDLLVMLRQLVEAVTWDGNAIIGGNGITDQIGSWAMQQGYEGILFFGARAIGEVEKFKLDERVDWHGLLETTSETEMLVPLRVPGNINLVAFSGTRLVSQTRSFSIAENDFDRTRLQTNPHHGQDPDELLAQSDYDEDYQLERGGIIYVTKAVMGPTDPKQWTAAKRAWEQRHGVTRWR